MRQIRRDGDAQRKRAAGGLRSRSISHLAMRRHHVADVVLDSSDARGGLPRSLMEQEAGARDAQRLPSRAARACRSGWPRKWERLSAREDVTVGLHARERATNRRLRAPQDADAGRGDVLRHTLGVARKVDTRARWLLADLAACPFRSVRHSLAARRRRSRRVHRAEHDPDAVSDPLAGTADRRSASDPAVSQAH